MARNGHYNTENSAAVQALGSVLIALVFVSIYFLYRMLEPPNPEAEINSQTYVTLVTSQEDIIGMKTLAYSLNQVKTRRKLIVIVGDITEDVIDDLRASGYKIYRPKNADAYLYGKQPLEGEYGETRSKEFDEYAKLSIWEMDYSKAIYIAPTCIVLKNIDELFQLDDHFASVHDCCDMFDSNFFVTTPNRQTLAHLSQAFRTSEGINEEIFLNQYFSVWKQLSFQFNAQQKHVLTLPQDLWHLDKWKVLCYDVQKPWKPSNDEKILSFAEPWTKLNQQMSNEDL